MASLSGVRSCLFRGLFFIVHYVMQAKPSIRSGAINSPRFDKNFLRDSQVAM